MIETDSPSRVFNNVYDLRPIQADASSDNGVNLTVTATLNEEETVENQFIANLAELDNGRLLTALGDKLAEVVAAVKNTAKTGSLTLKITVKTDAKATPGDAEIVMIEPEVTTKIPEFDKSATVFFAGDDGQLHRQNPNKPRYSR